MSSTEEETSTHTEDIEALATELPELLDSIRKGRVPEGTIQRGGAKKKKRRVPIVEDATITVSEGLEEIAKQIPRDQTGKPAIITADQYEAIQERLRPYEQILSHSAEVIKHLKNGRVVNRRRKPMYG